MNKLDLVANAIACQRFSTDCATIKKHIHDLQMKNNRLSIVLDGLLEKQRISINRIKNNLNISMAG
ncbi:hypothetical protein [Dyadobacter sediminis]|uniref:Uncharacterized protein n=1 Tax=Dyadobacter sediminis TaxID=1493691 RepID=A0A5R9KJL9_9BACT|nr:hypothetical protein [Dyadobacter sediminis]TLU96392.1 hypothetical protein FEM55_04455 [Dyadobacter sediminis]GGB81867.1 hypothetical protein GCM10011325_06680 [Dyadobacter sediminis]